MRTPSTSSHTSADADRRPVAGSARPLSATIHAMRVGQHVIAAVLLVIGASRALTDGTSVALVLAV